MKHQTITHEPYPRHLSLTQPTTNASGERLLFGLTLEQRWLAVMSAVIVVLLIVEAVFPALDLWIYGVLK